MKSTSLLRRALITFDAYMAAKIHVTIDNLPRQTSARAHAVNHMHDIALPGREPKVLKPVLVTHIDHVSDEDADTEPDYCFEAGLKSQNGLVSGIDSEGAMA